MTLWNKIVDFGTEDRCHLYWHSGPVEQLDRDPSPRLVEGEFEISKVGLFTTGVDFISSATGSSVSGDGVVDEGEFGLNLCSVAWTYLLCTAHKNNLTFRNRNHDILWVYFLQEKAVSKRPNKNFLEQSQFGHVDGWIVMIKIGSFLSSGRFESRPIMFWLQCCSCSIRVQKA